MDPAARRVVLAIIDGLRPDAVTASTMPALSALRGEGWFTEGITVRPSITVAALTSLATGVGPATHRLTAPTLPPLETLRRAVPLPRQLRRHGHRTALATNHIALGTRLLAGGLLRVAGIAGIAAHGHTPAEAAAGALALVARRRPSLLTVYVNQTDLAGHAHGWMSVPYLTAARAADRLVAALRSLLDDGETTLLVTADHGGGGVEATDHDLPHPVNDAIPIIAAGAGIVPGAGERASLLDLPPTILHLLGVPIPAAWHGRPLLEAMTARRAAPRPRHAPEVFASVA